MYQAQSCLRFGYKKQLIEPIKQEKTGSQNTGDNVCFIIHSRDANTHTHTHVCKPTHFSVVRFMTSSNITDDKWCIVV